MFPAPPLLFSQSYSSALCSRSKRDHLIVGPATWAPSQGRATLSFIGVALVVFLVPGKSGLSLPFILVSAEGHLLAEFLFVGWTPSSPS